MALLPAVEATPDRIGMESNQYARFTGIFGIPRKERKDLERTEVPVFGIEVNKNLFITCLSRNKLHKACELSAAVSNKQSITLLKV